MYDGASALAEAAVLAARSLNRRKIAVARTVHPQYRKVLGTYAWANNLEIVEIPYMETGRVDPAALEGLVDGGTAAVMIQSPNFFGVVEDFAPAAALAHGKGALAIAGFTDATSLGLFAPPGALGADMAAGEGQAFGNPLGFGGPYLGILAASAPFLRKIPGRIAGATVDGEGNRGFVLTLQTREQHIRREKATSNICSNESLCALAAAVYLAAVGKNLRGLAALNVRKAAFFRDRLSAGRGFGFPFSGPVYNEFVLRCPDPRGINEALEKEGIVGGFPLEGDYPELPGTLLLCATETLSRSDIERAVSIIHRAAG
jgi:glycine dehydrogenase subunit 1